MEYLNTFPSLFSEAYLSAHFLSIFLFKVLIFPYRIIASLFQNSSLNHLNFPPSEYFYEVELWEKQRLYDELIL